MSHERDSYLLQTNCESMNLYSIYPECFENFDELTLYIIRLNDPIGIIISIAPVNWTALGQSMMTSSNENIFRVTGPLCGEFIGHRRIPCTNVSDSELRYFV